MLWLLFFSLTSSGTDAATTLNQLDQLIEYEAALGCNTSQTPMQWTGWLLVLAVLFISQRPPNRAQAREIHIRSDRRSNDR